MKRLSFATVLMVLLAFSPMAFAQYNLNDSGSQGYGGSDPGEQPPSMEGGENFRQQQEGAEPEPQETSPDNPADNGEMQAPSADEGNADPDNANQDMDADNPDSAGSQDSGESARPRE